MTELNEGHIALTIKKEERNAMSMIVFGYRAPPLAKEGPYFCPPFPSWVPTATVTRIHSAVESNVG